MTFLPIVTRELRVASRRGGTYWIRAGAAGLGLIIAVWIAMVMRHSHSSELGIAFFGWLSGVAVLYCLFSGVRWTSDCLSQEKREGTLGLLFLTDLRGYDVVFGKLTANSITAIYAVMAIVPILALPLLLGGVTLGDVGRMALLALNTMFLSLSLGMVVSSFVRNARKSAGSLMFIILVMAALLPALGGWLGAERKIQQLHPLFFYSSPGFAYFWAYDVNYRGGAPKFWGSMITIHALAWASLLLATVVTPRSWQDRAFNPQSSWRNRLRTLVGGSREAMGTYRKALLDKSPVLWLLARSPLKAGIVWAVIAALGAGWFWGWSENGEDWVSPPVFILSGLVLNLLLKGWVAAEAGRQFAEDRRQGALELLLCTPLELKEIFRGQWLALQRQFLGPLIFVLLLFFLFLVLGIEESPGSERGLWFLFWTAAMFMLVADLYAIYWVGMWQGITTRNPNRLAAETTTRILVLPWLGIALFILLAAIGAASGGSVNMTPTGFIMLWLVLGLLTDVVFGFIAFDRLHSRFREMAARKYLQQPSFWARFFGRS